MNLSLLDKIASVDTGFLATVLRSEGHTYKKAGARALFRAGDPLPLHGNLGSLCADQQIMTEGSAACADGKPRVIRVDTTPDADADLGTGTGCGGAMEILLEPLTAEHKRVYRMVRGTLESRECCYLAHDLTTGSIDLHADEPEGVTSAFVERIDPPRRVVVFGATPLALRLEAILRPTGFDVHIVDWRSAYLDAMPGVETTRRHLGDTPAAVIDENAFVVIVSHSYRRDMAALRCALDAGAAYVGVLSSRPRRDRIFGELIADGVSTDALRRVSSPVGLDIGGRTDGEIALSIAAEIVKAEAK